MKILVTGSKGFIGKNLVAELRNRGYNDIFCFDRENKLSLLDAYCKDVDFVYHLAGVNRPKEEKEFILGNRDLTVKLVEFLKKHHNHCSIMLSSSIQSKDDNPYGISKREAEKAIFNYGSETNVKQFVYRFPNVFGKWSRPNYNSVVATFCCNISHGKEITISNPQKTLNLVYIDDVVDELISALKGNEHRIKEFCEVVTTYTTTLEELANKIYAFKQSRNNLSIADMSDPFTKKLYSTYLSYLPKKEFSYPLKMNRDERGSFTEFIKTIDRGQISVNISKSGVTKGNHWHHSKNEKFLVVSGEAVIRLRQIDSEEIIEYKVNGENLEVIDIPTGYTHNIENVGTRDMVTIIWANEQFDPHKPDTYYLEI